jgi:hypothetical protein
MGNLVFQAALGGQVALSGPNTASNFTITVPAVTGTMITTGDTGTVTNTMLVNSTISGVALGSNLFSLTSGTGISFNTGTTYNGSAAITINSSIVQATATALGTVYAKQTTGGGSPYLTAFGYNAGVSTTGAYNTAVGTQALYTNSSGVTNTAVGYQSLYSNTTTNNCTAVGYQSGYSNNGGDGNSNFGTNAGYAITTGNNNVCIGTNAGYGNNVGGVNLTTGGSGIYIGGYSQPSVSSNIFEIVIGYNTAGKGSSTGYIYANGGGTYQGNNQATWSITSDQRLKKNIVDNNVGLDKVSQIQVRNFEYRTEDEITDLPKNQVIKKEGLQLGAIAQELQAVLPDCVKEESTGVLSVNSDNIMWHMINAIKELNAKVIALETRLGS